MHRIVSLTLINFLFASQSAYDDQTCPHYRQPDREAKPSSEASSSHAQKSPSTELTVLQEIYGPGPSALSDHPIFELDTRALHAFQTFCAERNIRLVPRGSAPPNVAFETESE